MTEQQSPPPGAADPPPFTEYAWRTGLVRPVQGRVFAGVCGALGRATRTDPILWRVLIAVLAVFGVGVFLYLLGWLLLPADGDTASPVESVLGRGHSATSAVLTIIGAIVVLSTLPVIVVGPFRPGPWSGVLIVVALLLLIRERRHTHPIPPTGVPMSSPTNTPGPAFAPRGPFAPPVNPIPGGPFAPPVPPVPGTPPVMPRPPRQRRERSRLGLLTFSLLLVVVGLMASLDLLEFNIPPAAYFAAALAVVGVGLIIGTWVGRARGLIAVGILLIILTGGASAPWNSFNAGNRELVVNSFTDLESNYEQNLGSTTLDLSRLDFAGRSAPVQLSLKSNMGNMTVIVPRDVDVTLSAEAKLSNVSAFDQSWGGWDTGRRQITDNGSDGPGGGQLHIDATLNMSNLEVSR